MRQTSVDAWNAVNHSGLLGQMQIKVYNLLYERGPLTGRQVDQILAAAGDNTPSYHKRLSELERMGVVQIVSETVDRKTNQTCVTWDVTNRRPVRPRRRIGLQARITRATQILDQLLEKDPTNDAVAEALEALGR